MDFKIVASINNGYVSRAGNKTVKIQLTEMVLDKEIQTPDDEGVGSVGYNRHLAEQVDQFFRS